ncbi:MAG TPA: di-heme oxidoredictase family protein [Marinospirillum sp.]|uniref:di-heme oxidoreductase family protein n=1 Tax=Marinospirillum sp. TaxID=2183934 RepID=UPI002B4962F6|nr:di-heme oxidoredictase family protein [Marinospirillum sp.]HKM14501.1 di-heme oxidoredictase family protein [Marinospirillum sp.]
MPNKPLLARLVSSKVASLLLLLIVSSWLNANPQLPAGETTATRLAGKHSFSQHAANMTLEQRMDFNLGQAIFGKLWVSSPSSTTASDGLGPLYNARSCLNCHTNNGRGQPPKPDTASANARSLFLRLSIPPQNQQQQALLTSGKQAFIPEPVYGGQLQDQSVQGLVAEGQVTLNYTFQTLALAGGEQVELRQPHYSITKPAYGELHPQLRTSARVTPPMPGLGLLEAISESELHNNVAAQKNHPEIAGQLNHVWDIQQQKTVIGRFGWKAIQPNLKQQNAAAFIEDIGISSAIFPQGYGGCTSTQSDCRRLPDGNSEHLGGVEASPLMTEVLEFYVRTLAIPPRRNAQKPEVLAGEKIFQQLDCAACHRPHYVTEKNAHPLLASQSIWPYTDLLLHNMGDGLADEHSEFLAKGNQWRTPALWGVGLTQLVSGHSQLLHDGRARNVQEAILWHGGEAESSKQQFMALPKHQRQQLIHFVESL